jgi:hypothetical protein
MPIKVKYNIRNIEGEDKELVMWPLTLENTETELKVSPDIFIAQEEFKSAIEKTKNKKINGVNSKLLKEINPEVIKSPKIKIETENFLSPYEDSLSDNKDSTHNQSGELNSNDESFITCEGTNSPRATEDDEVWYSIAEANDKMPLHNNITLKVNPIHNSHSNETFKPAYENEEDVKDELEIRKEDVAPVDNEVLNIVKAEFSQDEKKTLETPINIETDSIRNSLSSKLTASQLEDTLPEFKLLQKVTMTPKRLTETTSDIVIKNRLSEKDREQIQKDIGRSMNNFDYFNSLNEESAADYKTQLKQMLIELLSKSDFHYYQGYNELCSVFLLILGKKQGSKAAEMTSYNLIKDFLLDSFEKGVQPMLFMLNDLLKVADKELYEAFSQLGVISCINVGSSVCSPLVAYLVCS